jgi:hypothetical protein
MGDSDSGTDSGKLSRRGPSLPTKNSYTIDLTCCRCCRTVSSNCETLAVRSLELPLRRFDQVFEMFLAVEMACSAPATSKKEAVWMDIEWEVVGRATFNLATKVHPIDLSL